MADADDDWSDVEDADAQSERENAAQGAEPGGGTSREPKRTPRKARNHRDDGDFESQQSILKWVRRVPGPLQDVMKKQADQMESENFSEFASGNSDRYSVTISTVFDDGPWVDMCNFLGMETKPGTVYGGIKVSRLKYTLLQILEDDKAPPKVPQLLLLIKSTRYVDEEIVAVFHDPTADIEGYFHREIVEQIGPALTEGVGILLRNVSVFTPVSTRGESFLNIMPNNLQRVFIGKLPAGSTYEAAIQQFNATRELELEEEPAVEDINANESPTDPPLLQQANVRHTSTELSYLSQRQVVHRNPPVNSTAANIMSGRSTNAEDRNAESEATGLGRWQWSRLAQKNSSNDNDNDDGAGTANTESTPASAATSRFVSMLSSKRRRKEKSGSKQITIDEDDSDRNDDEGDDSEKEDTGSPQAKKRVSTKVTFAPDVEVSTTTTQPSALAKSSNARAPKASVVVEDDEDDDDDDDW